MIIIDASGEKALISWAAVLERRYQTDA